MWGGFSYFSPPFGGIPSAGKVAIICPELMGPIMLNITQVGITGKYQPFLPASWEPSRRRQIFPYLLVYEIISTSLASIIPYISLNNRLGPFSKSSFGIMKSEVEAKKASL